MPSNFGILRVLVVEDDPVILNAVRLSVARTADLAVVGEAHTGADGISKFRMSDPEVLLVDIHVPRDGGLEVIRRARALSPKAIIVAFATSRNEAMAARVLAAGASVFMLTGALLSDLRETIGNALGDPAGSGSRRSTRAHRTTGASGLTEREVEVLRSVAAGHTNREIAALMGISQETVKGHLKSITVKLGARHRTEAVAMAYRQGVIGL